jgi:peptidoglycan hydrolase CwlO-like protein
MAEEKSPAQKKAEALAARIKSSNDKVMSYQKSVDEAQSALKGYTFTQHLGTEPTLSDLDNRLKEINAVFSDKSIKQLCNKIASNQQKIVDLELKQINNLITSAAGIKAKRKKVSSKQKEKAGYEAIISNPNSTQEEIDKAAAGLVKLLTAKPKKKS